MKLGPFIIDKNLEKLIEDYIETYISSLIEDKILLKIIADHENVFGNTKSLFKVGKIRVDPSILVIELICQVDDKKVLVDVHFLEIMSFIYIQKSLGYNK